MKHDSEKRAKGEAHDDASGQRVTLRYLATLPCFLLGRHTHHNIQWLSLLLIVEGLFDFSPFTVFDGTNFAFEDMPGRSFLNGFQQTIRKLVSSRHRASKRDGYNCGFAFGFVHGDILSDLVRDVKPKADVFRKQLWHPWFCRRKRW